MYIPYFMGTSIGGSVPHKSIIGLKMVFHGYEVVLFVELICPLGHLEYQVMLLGFF